MGIKRTDTERIQELERENNTLRQDLETANARIEYMAIMDHPEILEGEETEE